MIFQEVNDSYGRPEEILPELTWETLEGLYPQYPSIRDLKIPEEKLGCVIDIAPYVQIGPHVVNGASGSTCLCRSCIHYEY